MEKPKLNSPLKYGNGLKRAKKISHKQFSKDLKHKRQWIENKMDNK